MTLIEASSQGGGIDCPSSANAVRTRRVLVVHPSGPLRDLMCDRLRQLGYEVQSADDGSSVLMRSGSWDLDVVLLSLDPSSEPVPACHLLGQELGVPVILMAPQGTEPQLLACLEVCGTDFVRSPVDLAELDVRIIGAVQKFAGGLDFASSSGVSIGPITIYPRRRAVEVRGEEVHFPAREYDLLLALASQPGRLRTRDELLEGLWGHRLADTKTLDVHVRRIRRKIERNPYYPRHIVTVRGIGYYFDPST
jgi:two-component system, OmpR family, response regulator RegX3